MTLVLLALLVCSAITVAVARWRTAVPASHPAPRELIRRAVAVLPAHPDPATLQHAVARIVGTDPRVDVLVVEPAAAGRPPFEQVTARVAILRQGVRCAPADALRAGAARGARGGYDAVIEVSAEHARLARRITSLLEALDDGAHVAVGSRHVPGGRVLECASGRRWLSRGVNEALRGITRLPLHDVTARIRAYRREAIEHGVLAAHGQGPGFGVEVLLRCRQAGLRFAEVPVTAAGCVCATTSLADGRHLVEQVLRWRRALLFPGGAARLSGVTERTPSTVR